MSATSYKVVLLGEGRVGKTSLLSRYTQNTFNDKEQSTVQASLYAQASVPLLGRHVLPGAVEALDAAQIEMPSSLPSAANGAVSVAIWDTAGQERYHALAPIYYRNADGAMLVFDVCDKPTLERVRTWTKELRAVAGNHIELVICGNKVDQPRSSHEVSEAETDALAQELGAALVWTSAKTGYHVAQAFSTMATVMAQASSASGRAPPGSTGARPGTRTAASGMTPPRPRRGQLMVIEDARTATSRRDEVGDQAGRGGAHQDVPQRVNLADEGSAAAASGGASSCC